MKKDSNHKCLLRKKSFPIFLVFFQENALTILEFFPGMYTGGNIPNIQKCLHAKVQKNCVFMQIQSPFRAYISCIYVGRRNFPSLLLANSSNQVLQFISKLLLSSLDRSFFFFFHLWHQTMRGSILDLEEEAAPTRQIRFPNLLSPKDIFKEYP